MNVQLDSSVLEHFQGNVSGSFRHSSDFIYKFPSSNIYTLIITGMYVLNDLFDAGLDRINEKIHRPLPSGKGTKRTRNSICSIDECDWARYSYFFEHTIAEYIGIYYSLDWYSIFPPKDHSRTNLSLKSALLV